MAEANIPIMFPHQIADTSWLNEERFKWFKDGFGYALTQTRSIPALSQVSPEELYFAVASVIRGAKRSGHSLDSME